jgi:4-diphosphocytidyl-2-C-methyl-D-erythritol kinase
VSPPGSIRCGPPAKVNLFLRVLGERADGYHEIETIFQAVSLHDDLAMDLVAGGGVGLDVAGAELGPATSNLAYLAARAVLDAAGSDAGLRVRLEKRIPAGAGLGGGSSDAAAALRCANALLGDPLKDVEVAEIAERLGSDVPFFLGPSTLALGRGRGERLEALPPLPDAHLVLVLPPVHVDTGWAYGALAEHRRGGGEAPGPGSRGGVPRTWADVAGLAVNDFEAMVASAHREVAASLEGLRRAGATPALLSGSGSACFGIFADAGSARRAAELLSRSLPWPSLVARTLRDWRRGDGAGETLEARRP